MFGVTIGGGYGRWDTATIHHRVADYKVEEYGPRRVQRSVCGRDVYNVKERPAPWTRECSKCAKGGAAR